MEKLTYEIHIQRDEYNEPFDPESWGCQMVCFHRKYSLPNTMGLISGNFSGWEDLRKHIEKQRSVLVMKPVYLMDHGGLVVSTYDFDDPWDSGQIGYIWVEKPENKRRSKKMVAAAEQSITWAIDNYNAHLSGDLWSFDVYVDDECIEAYSCIPGLEHTKAEAKRVLVEFLKGDLP